MIRAKFRHLFHAAPATVPGHRARQTTQNRTRDVYTPRANVEDRLPVLRDCIATHPLAAVVTLCGHELVASHIPMVYVDDGSPFGMLRGHVSRANSQWSTLTEQIDALAIFSGPQHYVSAGWYPTKQEHGKVVPTWNYVVVHVSGKLRIIHDETWLREHLESLTQTHESQFATPWHVSDAPATYIASQIKGIVGYELPIGRIEGKWKVSQNRNARDRQGVVDGLGQLDTPAARAMQTLVADAATDREEPES